MWDPKEPLSSAISQAVYGDYQSSGEEENESLQLANFLDIKVEEFEEPEPTPQDPSLRLEADGPDGYSSSDDSEADEYHPHFRVVQDSPRRGRGAATRGGRAGRGRRHAARLSGWTRGTPLQERFMDDADLPDDIREAVARLLAGHIRQNDRERGRRAVNEDGENVEEEFFVDTVEDFEWRPISDWAGVKETFLPESTGPTRDCSDVYNTFRCIWDDKILSHIVTETNRHAQGIQSPSFQKDWYPTNLDEIMILFAFWMMLGIIKMPTIKSCFSRMPLLRTEAFRSLFTERRYWYISRAFQLANGSADPNDPGNVLYPMGPVIDHLNEKFKILYNLQQDVCISESTMQGPVKLKQYIKTKAAKLTIKTYQLCESATGYLWSFVINVGRQTSEPTIPVSFSTVLKLARPILNLGHNLHMDDWFNSPMLARFLKRRKTDCVGILRPSLKDVCCVVQKAPLAEGEFIARHCGDVMTIAIQDRTRISLISTFHDLTQIQTETNQYRLKLLDDYNHGTGVVDRSDQMLEPYLLERNQCLNWSKNMFKRFLNASIKNTRILHERSTLKSVDSLSFRLLLVQEIINHHLPNVPIRPQPSKVNPLPDFSTLRDRLTGRHFIRRIEITDEMRANVVHRSNLGRKACMWCARRNPGTKKKTVYECDTCKVAVCLEGCFKNLHTIP